MIIGIYKAYACWRIAEVKLKIRVIRVKAGYAVLPFLVLLLHRKLFRKLFVA